MFISSQQMVFSRSPLTVPRPEPCLSPRDPIKGRTLLICGGIRDCPGCRNRHRRSDGRCWHRRPGRGSADGEATGHIIDVGGRITNAKGSPSASTTTWYLVPGLPRSAGFGPTRSPPRLARTLQLSTTASLGALISCWSAPDHPEQAGMDLVQDAGGRPCSQAATQGGTGPVGQRSKTRPGAARRGAAQSSRTAPPHAGKNGGWQRRLWWLLEDGRVPETAAGSRRSGEQSDQQAKWAGFLNSITTPSDGKDAAPIKQLIGRRSSENNTAQCLFSLFANPGRNQSPTETVESGTPRSRSVR